MKDYLNTNKLKDGKFPANVVCPFDCFKKNCPGKDKNRNNTFSCALARALSLNV